MAEIIVLGLIVYFLWYHVEAKKLAQREELARKQTQAAKRKDVWLTNSKVDDKK